MSKRLDTTFLRFSCGSYVSSRDQDGLEPLRDRDSLEPLRERELPRPSGMVLSTPAECLLGASNDL